MNTVIGFSCAMGVDMGFNKHHHDEEETVETTGHNQIDGEKAPHQDEGKKHHHDSKENSEKEGCCNGGVMKFQNLDKSLALNGNVAINTPAFVAIPSIYFGVEIFKLPQVHNQKYIFDFFHPPPPDIRILIQSFQI